MKVMSIVLYIAKRCSSLCKCFKQMYVIDE